VSELTDKLNENLKTAQLNIKLNISVSAIAGPYPPELWKQLEIMARQIGKRYHGSDWQGCLDTLVDVVLTKLPSLDNHKNLANYLVGAALFHYSNVHRVKLVDDRAIMAIGESLKGMM